MPRIDQSKILIMATNRFEESELFGPREILIGAGATVALASLDMAEIMGTVHDAPGRRITLLRSNGRWRWRVVTQRLAACGGTTKQVKHWIFLSGF